MQIILSSIGDKYGSRRALAGCLLGSALSMVTFGFWNNPSVLAMLLFLNGTAQSTAWPNCVKSLTNWFSDQRRTAVFGLFGTSSFVGGILGTALTVQLQSVYAPDLKFVFLIPSLIVGGVGILVYLSLHSPKELGIMAVTEPSKSYSGSSGNESSQNQLTYQHLWGLSMIPELCWASCCVKLVRYCMYMWLPMYLYQALNYTKYQSGYLSTVFEVGGVLGTTMLGFIFNRFLQGKVIYGVTVILFSGTVFMALFQYTGHWGISANAIFMFLAGACNCGVDPYLTGSIPAEIGEHENAQAATSGLVNGFGGLGPIVEGPLVGWIADKYGWTAPFYLMVATSLIGFLMMLKASRMDQLIKEAELRRTLPLGKA
ncbi:sugar phosphate exchanger 3-like isoform X2 [Acropora palmata]